MMDQGQTNDGNPDGELPMLVSPDNCAKVLKVLADGTRLQIVNELFDGPKVVSEINQKVQAEPTLLSHHLKVLRDSGIVVSSRVGKMVCYELSESVKKQLSGKELNFGCCKISFSE